MTRDEIYEHLAQVYLGKKNTRGGRKPRRVNAWLVINVVITVVIFASVIYGLTAFLTHKGKAFHDRVIYSLHNGPIRLSYNLEQPFPPVKTFSLDIPSVNAARYKNLQFSVRGLEEGHPGIIRVELKNKKNETASVYVEDIGEDWQTVTVPLDEFLLITDWTNVTEVSFVLESWNARKKKGILLIDNVCFSS